MARQADALGLDAAEVRRREAVLAELSLECINQVNQYDLRAQNATPGEIRLVGLPRTYRGKSRARRCADSPEFDDAILMSCTGREHVEPVQDARHARGVFYAYGRQKIVQAHPATRSRNGRPFTIAHMPLW